MHQESPNPALALAETLDRCEGYSELGMHEAAWNELEDLPSELKQDFAVLSWRVQILVGLKEHEKASFIGLTLVQHHPEKLGILLLTTQCLIEIKDFIGARFLLRHALTWHSNQPDVWLQLARVEAHLQDYDEVKKCVTRYTVLYPEGRGQLLDDSELGYLFN